MERMSWREAKEYMRNYNRKNGVKTLGTTSERITA